MADKILIVDDDADLRGELRDFLEGYEVLEASDGREALHLLGRAHEVGLVILDVMMPGLSGLDVLTEIKKNEPSIHIIILTGHSSKDTAIEALKGRADDYIEKPIKLEKITEAVERLMGARRGEADSNTIGLAGKIAKVKLFLQRNCYKKTTLKEAASAVCLSPKYLSRIFKQTTGKGFSDYKLALKIAKAREFLTGSGYNVNQISDKLGYKNTESFIRQFKKIAGGTPLAYRSRMLRRSAQKRARARRKRQL